MTLRISRDEWRARRDAGETGWCEAYPYRCENAVQFHGLASGLSCPCIDRLRSAEAEEKSADIECQECGRPLIRGVCLDC